MVLDRSQPTDDAHGENPLRDRWTEPLKTGKIKSQGDNLNPVRSSDFVSLANVSFLRSTYDEDPVGESRKKSFDLYEGQRLEGAEIAVKHVAVKGVDQADFSPENPLSVHADACQPTQGPCFCGMGVNQVRFELADDLSEFKKGSEIIESGHLSSKSWEHQGIHLLGGCQVRHVPLMNAELPANQTGAKTTF